MIVRYYTLVTERHESVLLLLGVTPHMTTNTLKWLVAIIMYFWCLHKWNAVSLIWSDVVYNLAMFHVSSLKTKFKFQQLGMFMFRFHSAQISVIEILFCPSPCLVSRCTTKTTDMKLLPKDSFNFVLSSLFYFCFPSSLHKYYMVITLSCFALCRYTQSYTKMGYLLVVLVCGVYQKHLFNGTDGGICYKHCVLTWNVSFLHYEILSNS